MDCRTATLLFELAPPGSLEFDPAEASALEAHLASCPACSQRAEALRHEQSALRRAMQAVPVPAGEQRLLKQLTAQRHAWYRRLPMRHPRWAAAASLFFFLLLGGTLYGWLRPLPFLDAEVLNNVADAQVHAPPDQVERDLAQMGMRVLVPRDFDYNYLVSYSGELFQGRIVPRLEFRSDRHRATAYVYILSAKHFDRDKTLAQPRSSSGTYTIEFRPHPTEPKFFYMIKFTGENLDWVQAFAGGVGA